MTVTRNRDNVAKTIMESKRISNMNRTNEIGHKRAKGVTSTRDDRLRASEKGSAVTERERGGKQEVSSFLRGVVLRTVLTARYSAERTVLYCTGPLQYRAQGGRRCSRSRQGHCTPRFLRGRHIDGSTVPAIHRPHAPGRTARLAACLRLGRFLHAALTRRSVGS